MTSRPFHGANEARGGALRDTGAGWLRGIDRGLAGTFALLMLVGIATL